MISDNPEGTTFSSSYTSNLNMTHTNVLITPLFHWRRRRGTKKRKVAGYTFLHLPIIFVLAFATTSGFLSTIRTILIELDELESGGEGKFVNIDSRLGRNNPDTGNTFYGPSFLQKSRPMLRGTNQVPINIQNIHPPATRAPTEIHKPVDSTTTAHSPPRKMADTSNPVYFLHVGKAGGTSVDSLFSTILKHKGKRYIGHRHYDWSFIQKDVQKHQSNLPDDENGVCIEEVSDVITFLRHPVSRATSQFYFSKKLSWAKRSKSKFIHQTFDEYLDDPNKTWLQPIADGESGSDFLAGIFSTKKGCWVASDGIETSRKQYLRENKTAACLFAAERLENTTWFGLMEDIERSMKLLQSTLGLKDTPILPKRNGNGSHPSPSAETVGKIEKCVPKDLWLYEYAKRLFEARWNYFVGNATYVSPELPPLPDFDSWGSLEYCYGANLDLPALAK